MENKYELDMVSIRLVKEPGIFSDKKVRGVDDAVEVIGEYISEYDREIFCVMNVKTDGSVINMNIVSQGTLNSSEVSPREVFKSSILSNSAAVLLFHNHPSGDVKPSKQDYEATKRLVQCGKLLGIPVMDHIIVGAGEGCKYSFLAHNELGLSYKQAVKKREVQER